MTPSSDTSRRGPRAPHGTALVLAALILGGAGAFGLLAIGDGLAERSADGITVTAYLVGGGIDPAAIELDGLGTSINYRWTDQGMTAEISSYSAYRNLRVRTGDVHLVDRLSRDFGTLLVTGIGVSSYSPEYLLSDLPALRPQLLEAAVADALVRAEAMLSVVGGEVGTIRSVRSGPFQVNAPDSVDVSDYGMYDTSTIAKSVGATVSVTFRAR